MASNVSRPAVDQARAASRLLRRVGAFAAAAAAAILLLRIAPSLAHPHSLAASPLLAVFAASPLPGLLLGALMLVLAGLSGAGAMAWARELAASPPLPPSPAPPAFGWLRPVCPPPRGDPTVIGTMARWPQAILVGVPALICLWFQPATLAAPIVQASASGGSASIILGAAAIVLCFPLLVAERSFAALPTTRLPEARALHALILLSVLAWAGAGLVQIAAGLGLRAAGVAAALIAVVLSAVAVELTLRAIGRCFVPPPEPGAAQAAISSLLAAFIANGARGRRIAVPGHRHFGIDMSRSWALAYVRAALPHVALLLVLLAWGLSGTVLVGLDERAIYERFGAPVAVLHSGLHVGLPWPMGRFRRIEFGVIHETTLTGRGPQAEITRVGAEDPAPADADRLWEQTHPSELTFLVASTTPLESDRGARQSFQVVSADIRLLYRLGTTDEDALRAAYRASDPEALLRDVAGRVLSGFFAGRTLDQVLGENRETMAEQLRASMQRELTVIGCGMELASVVIEAIHPPVGAAQAYHYVQAAEIMAATSVAAERGLAIADVSKARQYATELVSKAQAAAAETGGSAQADLTRFNADRAAAAAGGEAFTLDRYLSDLTHALAKEQLIIVDHRIPVPGAPVIDLRRLGDATAPLTGPGME